MRSYPIQQGGGRGKEKGSPEMEFGAASAGLWSEGMGVVGNAEGKRGQVGVFILGNFEGKISFVLKRESILSPKYEGKGGRAQ